MDVANASMYDGSTAVPEAALMALRVTGRNRILVSRTVHPEYREVLRTYAEEPGHAGRRVRLRRGTGQIDLRGPGSEARRPDGLRDHSVAEFLRHGRRTFKQAAELAHARGALLVFTFTEAVSLGLLEPPRDADIVAGELQSFAISPSYGGPFAGIIATKDKFVRQMPGRLVGQTTERTATALSA